VQPIPEAEEFILHGPWNEYGPTLSPDGLFLVFSSTGPHPDQRGGWDLYLAWRDDPDGEFTEMRNIIELNTAVQEGSPHFSGDGSKLYFHRRDEDETGDIYVAQWDGVAFSNVQDVLTDPGVGVRHPSLTPDERVLYFHAYLAGLQDADLYVVERETTDVPFDWKNAGPLEGGVNTEHSEYSPCLARDGCTLFFTRGSLELDRSDIWVARRQEDSGWAAFGNVKRLPGPVNTGREMCPSLSSRWPERGSKLFFVRMLGACPDGGDPCDWELYEATWDPPEFRRADTNSDSALDIADAIYTLLYAFSGGSAPMCLDTADSNDDGAIDVADAIFVLQYLFVEGPVIPPPYPGCGIDPTIDDLDCSSYEPCEGQ
jgi:hypothetical protein